MPRTPDDYLGELQQCAETGQAVMLLNYYQGVPITHESPILAVQTESVLLKVLPVQLVCLILEGRTTLQIRLFSRALSSRVEHIDCLGVTATLADFSPAPYVTGRRQSVRVNANPLAELSVGEVTAAGRLENISQKGMGLTLLAATLPYDPETAFEKGAAIRVRVQLPGEKNQLAVTGRVAHYAMQAGTCRLGLYLVSDATALRRIKRYIARRQADAEKELLASYEQICDIVTRRQPKR